MVTDLGLTVPCSVSASACRIVVKVNLVSLLPRWWLLVWRLREKQPAGAVKK
jgi:hypothetical protein